MYVLRCVSGGVHLWASLSLQKYSSDGGVEEIGMEMNCLLHETSFVWLLAGEEKGSYVQNSLTE
jgi:hypothetical protein